MARTPAQAKSLEQKALAADNKSEGMRMLYEAGYSVQQVRDLFEVPYGFAYGVAKRGGFVEAAAERRPTKAAPAKAEAPARTRTAKAAAPARASRTARTAAKGRAKAKA